MSRQYPIWVRAINCNYASGVVTYGYKDTGETDIFIGSSSSNSHQFVRTLITRRMKEVDGETVHVFRFSVDDVILKEAVFADNKGRPGDMISMTSKIKELLKNQE